MANKNVKLGEAANSFYDPTSGLKVLPGQVVELDNKQSKSKKVTIAMRHGHLVSATDEDVENFANGKAVSNNDPSNDVDKDWDDFEVNEANLKKLNKSDLVELAMHLESEYSQEELESMTKDDLKEEILEIEDSK